MEYRSMSSVLVVVVTVLGSSCLPLVVSTSLRAIIMPTDTVAAAASTTTASSAPLPALPKAFAKEAFSLGASSVVNLWEHGLRVQNRGQARAGISTAAAPSPPLTVVAAHSNSMVNLVPQDTTHPLYKDDPAYTALRHAFLLDSFVPVAMNPQDEAMTGDAGLAVQNMNGRTLVFKRDQQGSLSVNGVAVSKQQRLSDGTQLYVVEKLLFSHEKDVREASSRLLQETANDGSARCPFGPCQPELVVRP